MMQQLEQFIRDLNKAWQEQRYDDLYHYFHQDVVLLPPGSSQVVEGVEAMVEGYRQFGVAGTIHDFQINHIKFYDYQTLVMCHMKFDVDYEIETGRFQEQGLEVYTIDPGAGAGEPKIVWRSQIALKK